MRDQDAPSRWSEEAKAETKSRLHPDHYCDRRYLRSSYNEGGFNRVAPKALGREDCDLYWIFEPLGRDWPRLSSEESDRPFTEESIPAWRECAARALEVAEALKNADSLSVMTLDADMILATEGQDWMWQKPPTDIEALNWFRQEKAEKEEQNAQQENPDHKADWYSCARGDVFLSGVTIYAAVAGLDVLRRPALHLIYSTKDEETGEDGRTFYWQLAEIAAELCEEAVSLIERDGKVYFSWSG